MSDREIRALERRAAADPSDEVAAEAARAARWRAGRPTAADRLAAILDDPEVRSAHWNNVLRDEAEEVDEVLVLADPHVKGATSEERHEIAWGLCSALGWHDRMRTMGLAAILWRSPFRA